MTYAMSLNNVGFAELTLNEMLCVDGGNWVKTAFGVVGGIAGGVGTFIGITAACAPVLTPFGSAIVAGACVPGGAAAGFATGVGVYDFFF